MSASRPSCLTAVLTKPHGGLSPWMPITTLPRFLISSGVIAKAERVMTAGAASSVAPAASTVRREGVLNGLSFMVFLRWRVLFRILPDPSSGGRGKLALQPRAVERQRPADGEIDQSDDAEHEQGLEDLVRDHAAGAG